MTTSFGISLALAGVIIVAVLLYPYLSRLSLELSRLTGRHKVFCPVHQEYATVRLKVLGAPLSSGYGAPMLEVLDCSLLKPGEKCRDWCLESEGGPPILVKKEVIDSWTGSQSSGDGGGRAHLPS